MKYDNELVSIIMPVYKLESHLHLFNTSLDGIFKQTHSNWELIIVCDAAEKNPKTVEIVKNLTNRDQRISAYAIQKRVGPGIARNIGYKHSHGSFLMFHDSDDFSVSRRIELLLDYLISKNESIVASNIKIDVPNIGVRTKLFRGTAFDVFVDGKRIRAAICLLSTMMTSLFFKYMGGFEKYGFSSDSIFAIKVDLFRSLLNIGPIPVMNEFLFIYRRHGESVSMNKTTLKRSKGCQKRQRTPLLKDLHPMIVSGKLKNASKEEIKSAIGIHNNLDIDQIVYRLF